MQINSNTTNEYLINKSYDEKTLLLKISRYLTKNFQLVQILI